MSKPDGSDLPGPLVLELDGEIDVARAEDVVARGEKLLQGATSAGQRLVVDMGRVEFIDSSGLSALLRLRGRAEERGVAVALRDVPRRVSVLLQLAGLDEVFPID
jgi:anti-sigma B factor antagonist